jgi:GAF domain-containing protein
MEQSLQRLRESGSAGQTALVNRLVEEAIELTGSKLGYFAILNCTETELTMLAWSQSAMVQCSMMTRPIQYPVEATGLWGDCLRERQAVVTNDYENCTRLTKKGYPDGHVPVKRHMNVPLRSGECQVGILGVGNKEDAYTDEDAARLQTLADAAWPILEPIVARPQS